MILFYVIFLISCIMLVLGIVFKRILSKKFRKFYRIYEEDYKFKEVREGGSNNSYYLVSGVDSNYISRYVLRNSSYEKSIILNYNENYKCIIYYVAQFNKKKKLIGLTKVYDKHTSSTSRILVLNKKTDSINIMVAECDGNVINQGYIVPKSKKQYFGEQLLASISLYSFLYMTFFIVLLVWFKDLAYTYLTSSMCGILLLSVLAVTILYLIISTFILDHKSKKEHLGGKVYYEFY